MYRVGLGSDIHSFKTGRKLFLGGVQCENEKGLHGHFDGDVVLHSLCDALLGALSLGELEDFFPDNAENKDRASSDLVSEVCLKVWEKEYHVVNVDIAVISEEALILPYRDQVRTHIGALLNIDRTQVSVKSTRSDKLGLVEGRTESVLAQTIVLLKKRQN